jgi:hypothetical protein
LQIEPNTSYRKYKEAAHKSLVDHWISQPRLDISPVWTPIIAVEDRKLQGHPVWIMFENFVFMLIPYRESVSLVITSSTTIAMK